MQEDIIAISHLTKNYGRFMALKDINLTMKSGRIIGLLGPNGSGKTTLIKILNGLLANYQGTIQIAQENLGTHAKSLISYLPDEPYFEDWMYAKDALSLFNDMYSDFDLTKCLNLMERFDLKKDMRIKSMSKGMKEKFQLCLVMSRNAKIYILDEPIAGVDPASREVILDVILGNYDKDALVIISTHLISDLESIFDEVIFIKNGEIVLHDEAEHLRLENGKSIDELFREVFRC